MTTYTNYNLTNYDYNLTNNHTKLIEKYNIIEKYL